MIFIQIQPPSGGCSLAVAPPSGIYSEQIMSYELPSIDTLIELATNQPEELERIRRAQIERLINSAPAHLQRRLRGLQFQIDAKRSLHNNPMGACVMLSKMMFDSLSQLNSVLHNIKSGDVEPPKAAKQAAILRFPEAASV